MCTAGAKQWKLRSYYRRVSFSAWIEEYNPFKNKTFCANIMTTEKAIPPIKIDTTQCHDHCLLLPKIPRTRAIRGILVFLEECQSSAQERFPIPKYASPILESKIV